MAPAKSPSGNDPSADLLRQEGRQPLDAFFAPRSVAVIGATERAGSVGRTVLWNLLTNPFGGAVYPVNPQRSAVLGIRSYPSVAALPERVDLAVVATPAASVPGVVAECAAAGIDAGIILSAGFREVGAAGALLEQEIARAASGSRMRIVGPNCLGVMSPATGLNATFAGGMARAGSVAFLSQSGALQTAILDWSLQQNVGFSAFVSLGSMLDVGWGDLIDYLGNDGRTRSILIYMESIGDARAFLSAAREVALRKPIIVIKGGRTPQAAQAAAAHTGTLAGSDEVLTAAFRRTGVLRVDTIADLFFMADTLAKQPRPRDRRLAILTNAGGPGVLAADALVSGNGALAALSPAASAMLDSFLPAQWSHGNPLDVLGDADPERYARAAQALLDDEGADGLLVILTPQDMTEPTRTAEVLRPLARRHPEKPLLASWMGGGAVEEGRRILSDAGIPVFHYADTAARIFNYMWKYSYNLRGLYETPALTEASPGARAAAGRIVGEARQAGRTLLSPAEAFRVLEAYGIPAAGPVEGVREDPLPGAGYDLIVASSLDPQFGPVLLFGAGGVLADVLKDRSLGLPPLNTTLARRLMEPTRIYRVLGGFRGRPPVDLAALEKLLVLFSQLVVEQRAIREIEINPLYASAERLVALDARIVLHGREIEDKDLPAPVIRPYPVQYVGEAVLHGGERVKIRPIRPEDEPKMVRFHQTLSQQSVYRRYAGMLKLDLRVAHERLARICFLDYDREMALVGEHRPPGEGPEEIVAVARLTRLPGTREAEFALLVSDALQGQGLGRELLTRLFQVGRDWGLVRIVAEILPENAPMRRLCRSLGFTFPSQSVARKDLG